jgi:alkylation response protein AidB-like acyl-CoA dehydrogenase
MEHPDYREAYEAFRAKREPSSAMSGPRRPTSAADRAPSSTMPTSFRGDGRRVRARDLATRAARRRRRRARGARAARAARRGGWLEPIRRQDWRACCLAREALAAASPLADAVFALQALGACRCCSRASAARALGRRRSPGARWRVRDDRAGPAPTWRRSRPPRAADGDAYVLDGAKTFISNAGIADVYTVFASPIRPRRAAASRASWCRPTRRAAVRRAQVLSAPHPLGEIAFEGCRVPAANRLGEEGRGLAPGSPRSIGCARPWVRRRAGWRRARWRRRWRMRARGGSSEAARRVPARAGEARAHGEPISPRRAWLVYRAAWAADGGAERVTLEAAMAKSFATEAAQRIVDDAVQVLGGAGVGGVAPGRSPLPRGAGAPHLRGDHRDPAPGDRGAAAAGRRAE